MKAVVFVNDQRMEIIIQRLRSAGIQVQEGRCEKDMEQIERMANKMDLVILPIQGVSDDGFIELKKRGYCMKDFFASLRKETLIFTGVITPYIKKLPQTVISLLAREEVVAANAALTAEGILAMVIQNTPRSLPEYRYDVIGFGHCGRAIAGLFHQLGLEVRIVSAHAHPESAQLPYSFIRLQEWQFQQPWPVVINTAPAEVISEVMVAGRQTQPLIIDIASRAVGVSERVYKRKDTHVIAAPPLPGIVAWQSAGEILADVILKEVKR